jgi:hypothetical protein
LVKHPSFPHIVNVLTAYRNESIDVHFKTRVYFLATQLTLRTPPPTETDGVWHAEGIRRR